MKNFIIRFLVWLLGKLESPKDLPPYLERAAVLVAAIDRVEQGGEWKRHQVYARLIKEFPQISRKDLGLAIEIAVQKL